MATAVDSAASNAANAAQLARTDSVVEASVSRGFRIRDVPAHVRRAIEEFGLTAPPKIRLSAINPKRRADINAMVNQRYYRDLKDKDIPSDAEVLKLVEERGEWSMDRKRRMEELQERTVREMALLWSGGFDPQKITYAQDLLSTALDLKQSVEATERTAEEKAEFHERLDRWVSYTKERADDAKYVEAAQKQGRPKYSPDADQQWLLDHAPTLEDIDRLNACEDLADKRDRVIRLNEERLELAQLQVKHARIFAGTAESRQQHTEEMAQLYFTCEACDEEGRVTGRLLPSFDELWNYPDDAIQWLLYESYYFHNEVPDEAREFMTTWGFLKADREETVPEAPVDSESPAASGESAHSDASPVPPPSRTDTEPVAATESGSSEPAPATT